MARAFWEYNQEQDMASYPLELPALLSCGDSDFGKHPWAKSEGCYGFGRNRSGPEHWAVFGTFILDTIYFAAPLHHSVPIYNSERHATSNREKSKYKATKPDHSLSGASRVCSF